MSFSPLPLSYCTNVHPGRSLNEVRHGLNEFTAPVAANIGRPLAAGLWLSAPVIRELKDSPEQLRRLGAELQARDLACYTLNAFPYGDFHSTRVKEQVYLPDWLQVSRLEYTRDCARVLAALLPEGSDGSISTVPLGFKGFCHPINFLDLCADQLLQLARHLRDLHHATGRLIRLAIEPEPFCVLETTGEAIAFFDLLWNRAADANELEIARRYLGLCYDVCHQAVEFEDISESIGQLTAAGIRINKLHITCALQLDDPLHNAEGRAVLARYAEQRYLHQTVVHLPHGELRRSFDLAADWAERPPESMLQADAWRIHFHVPVDAERFGPLITTRPQLKQALTAVAALDYAPHLEVETYTWEVLPGSRARTSTDLIEGLTRELNATHDLLESTRYAAQPALA